MTVRLQVVPPVCAGCGDPLVAHHGPPRAAVTADDQAAGQVWPGGGCAVAGCPCTAFCWPDV